MATVIAIEGVGVVTEVSVSGLELLQNREPQKLEDLLQSRFEQAKNETYRVIMRRVADIDRGLKNG